MSNVLTILVGSASPRALWLRLRPGNTVIDLTTATSVTLDVRDRLGVSQTWETTIDSASAELLECHHTFDAAGAEVGVPGRLSIVATISTPAGPFDAGPFYLNVLDR